MKTQALIEGDDAAGLVGRDVLRAATADVLRPGDVLLREEADKTPQTGHEIVPAQPRANVEGAPPAPEQKPRRSPVKRVLPVVLLAILAGGGWYGYRWWTDGRFIVTTDDAYVGADIATLSARVAGTITDVPVDNNQAVRAGDPLVRIDPRDYQIALDQQRTRLATAEASLARIDAQIAQARTQVDSARAQVDAAQADVVRTEADFQRASALAQRDFGSRATLDTARGARDRAVAMLASSRAGVSTAEANVQVLDGQRVEAARNLDEIRVAIEKAQRDLDSTTVRAPFDGVVGNRAAQPGSYIAPGQRLLALVPLTQVYVDANFKETELRGIAPGAEVRISVDAYPDHDVHGRVESIAPGSGSVFSLLPPDNATGNFTRIVQRVPVRIAIPADEAARGLLRPGMSVYASVDRRTAPAQHERPAQRTTSR